MDKKPNSWHTMAVSNTVWMKLYLNKLKWGMPSMDQTLKEILKGRKIE